jgi:Sulfotransferase domain
MTLQVIGAGLGRTGTMTLKTALEAIGFAPCHHMVEVFAHMEEQAPFWLAAAKGQAVDWDKGLAGYRASVDWPSAHFYKQLAAHYPDAKVILSRRDPQRWFESMSETILKSMAMHPGGGDHPMQFARMIVVEQTLGGDLSAENVMAAFERHNAEVIASIAPERLLVFEAAQGWEPLCAFLKVPVPDVPFPRTNSREEFWNIVRPGSDAAGPG